MRRWRLEVLAATWGLAWLCLAAPVETAAADGAGDFIALRCPSPALRRDLDVLVYVPAGYAQSSGLLPVLYLLHGRGDTMQAWLEAKPVLDELIATGAIPPLIAVAPDVPSSRRASYYVDSEFKGHGDLPPGEAVETAITRDLRDFIERRFRVDSRRGAQLVAGYSMGGYGAARLGFAHPDKFGTALVLSPALYDPLPPSDSSARTFGAFGRGAEAFAPDLYRALAQKWMVPTEASRGLRVFVAVGDAEPVRNSAGESLTSDAEQFARNCRRHRDVVVEWRLLSGGHSWAVWRPALAEGLRWSFRDAR